jgi:uncharacterized membrane protein SpoIIM required for sporulation
MNPQDLRQEREERWRQLEEHVSTIEEEGLSALPYDVVRELGGLYRMTVSSYAVLSELSLDRRLHRYLKNLIARAYLAIYHYDLNPDVHPARFMGGNFPALVRKHAGKLLVSAMVMLFSITAAMVLTTNERQYANVFIPESMAHERTSFASKDTLRDVLYSGRGSKAEERVFFSTYLFVHNTRIGIMSFGFGLLGGVPALINGSYNGLTIGSMAGLYHYHDLGYEFWGWVLPHGVTELLAIVICIQAGLIIGLTIVYPGAKRWTEAVAEAGLEAGQIVLGTIPMFLIAGVIEGVLRQVQQDTFSWQARHLFALATVVFWVWYFGFCGRRERTGTGDDAQRANSIIQM